MQNVAKNFLYIFLSSQDTGKLIRKIVMGRDNKIPEANSIKILRTFYLQLALKQIQQFNV